MSDLFIGPDLASDAEAAAVDAVLASLGVEPTVEVDDERLVRGGVHRRNERRHALPPALHALQRAAGWVSPGGVNHIAEVLGVAIPELTLGVVAPALDGAVVHESAVVVEA